MLSLLSAFSFVEEFRNVLVKHIYYGKIDFEYNKKTKKTEPVDPNIYDMTSLYHLIKLIGSMKTANEETAKNMLKKFFGM